MLTEQIQTIIIIIMEQRQDSCGMSAVSDDRLGSAQSVVTLVLVENVNENSRRRNSAQSIPDQTCFPFSLSLVRFLQSELNFHFRCGTKLKNSNYLIEILFVLIGD